MPSLGNTLYLKMLQSSQAKAQASQQKEAEDFERMRTQNLQLMQAQQIVNRERGAEFDRQSQVAEQTAKLSKSLGLERGGYHDSVLEEIARVGDLEGLSALQAGAASKATSDREAQLKLADIQSKLGVAQIGAQGRVYAADKGLSGRKYAADAAANARRYGADKAAEARHEALDHEQRSYLFEAAKAGLTSMGDIAQVTDKEGYARQKQFFQALAADLDSGMPMEKIKKRYGVMLDMNFGPLPQKSLQNPDPGTGDDGERPGFGAIWGDE